MNLIAFLVCFEELYQQMLAKALAHFFEAKLLLLDVIDFSLKVSLLKSIIFIFKSFLICYIHNQGGLLFLGADSEQIRWYQQRICKPFITCYGRIFLVSMWN